VGLAVLIPAALLAGIAGLPLGAGSLAGLALLLAGLLLVARRCGGGASGDMPVAGTLRAAVTVGEAGPEPGARLVARLAALALLAAIALLVGKVAAMPLWSWDHYAIWGVKARRIVAEGRLDLAFLKSQEMVDSRPDYPLGLPLAWRVLELGGSPSAAGYKLIHLGFGLALLVLLRQGLAALGTGPPLADGLAAWTACLPLFWDTEAVGLAEMPLALWAVAATLLLVPAVGRPGEPLHVGRSVAAGLARGLLPWIKQEGWTIALLLGVVALQRRSWLGRLGRAAWRPALPTEEPRRAAGRPGKRHGTRLRSPAAALAVLSAPFLVLAGLERWIAAAFLPPGVPFLSGEPLARLAERLPQAPELLARMGSYLVLPDALGFWPALAAAAVLAVVRRNGTALALAAVVAGQLALYVVLPFLAYLPPEMHLDASFSRVTAALMPLGVLAIGAALGGGASTPRGALAGGEAGAGS
jgi:hypothetical protein